MSLTDLRNDIAAESEYIAQSLAGYHLLFCNGCREILWCEPGVKHRTFRWEARHSKDTCKGTYFQFVLADNIPLLENILSRMQAGDQLQHIKKDR